MGKSNDRKRNEAVGVQRVTVVVNFPNSTKLLFSKHPQGAPQKSMDLDFLEIFHGGYAWK